MASFAGDDYDRTYQDEQDFFERQAYSDLEPLGDDEDDGWEGEPDVYDDELARDQILAQQELEDFEGLSFYDEGYDPYDTL